MKWDNFYVYSGCGIKIPNIERKNCRNYQIETDQTDMLYQIRNGTVSLEGKVILSHVDFTIKGKEKIAVVGRNGAGKTTLLRLIAGEIGLDRDDKRQSPGISCSRKLTIGMLRQSNRMEQEKTIEEILLSSCPQQDIYSKERFLYEMEYDRLFTGFGFQKQDKKKKLCAFSGGEQTKISLIQLLLQKPDILLLDEPTNHLDIETVEWLEEYLKEYENAVVFVSHDRFFLDQVVDTVYELSDNTLRRYAGNYTQYRTQKQKELVIQRKQYEQQQAEIERLEELIKKFKNKPKKAAFAKSRQTILNRMDKMPKPREDDVHIFTGTLEPKVLGSKWVFEADHLKIGYDRILLELSLRIKRGQKIGIIGNNGVGKSTFLKTVAGLVEPMGGTCVLGNQVLMGYFDQQSALIESEKSVMEHFSDLFPAMTQKEVRHTLGAYLFVGEAVAKRVSDLSGGEKARLILCELLTSRPNLLILDEPTNHMDIPAKETLESAFKAYSGTLLFVSHDRYFVSQVADAILVFENQSVLYYPFGYEHYLKKSTREAGRDIAAMVLAEDQAMIADLRAVPKAEQHRLKEIQTEEAYVDWRLRLAAEPMERAKKVVEMRYREYENILLQESLYVGNTLDDVLFTLQKELEEAWEAWNKACIEWLDLYLELE